MRSYLGLLYISLFCPVAVAEPLVLFTEEFFPYNYTENNKVQGVNADLLRQACAKAKLVCTFESLPWLRAYESALHKAESGLFSTARTPKREPQFHWIGPLASSTTYLYRLKSRPEVNPLDLEQAKAFGIAVTHGDIFEEYLHQQGYILGQNLLLVTRKTDAIPLFLAGKIDLLIGSEQVIGSWMSTYGRTRADVETVMDISFIGQNYLALNRKVSATTLRSLQRAIEQLVKQGEMERLIRHYQSRTMPPQRGP
ncbi:transporter substrate-binding domain-containing protein [Rheinheimera sediminis]|uniref:substrate-binding periplasmic protein n=1 Tax=Rheinheimera sp. YQF-1 TaxID=2499626 RepID=UPI000FD946D1|nr:transporter substrate-binding domain-containing protein [Rheinheimera sp. YQF-1]RVT44775.1 transporter substrate-binding domain-containing protein [Rheinheimera sp. YQF-1]